MCPGGMVSGPNQEDDCMRSLWIALAVGAIAPHAAEISQSCSRDDADGDDWTTDQGDCDDNNPDVHPEAMEVCNGIDDNCDGTVDGVDKDGDGHLSTACGGDDCADNDPDALECSLRYGGHRIDVDGQYYYGLYSDTGFGILGSDAWYGSSDTGWGPEGVAWSEDASTFYYNNLNGYVYKQQQPFGSTSTLIGNFNIYQAGGGVVFNGIYYVGDYEAANIYAMDVNTGETWIHSQLGSSACKPYFGNNSMAIDVDGKVYTASSCGIVVYNPNGTAVQLNSYSNLLSLTAMDANQELYSMDYSGNIIHFDKTTGAVLATIPTGYSAYATWTMAVDQNGDFVVNYYNYARIFSGVDGTLVKEWYAADYYPGTTGYYWYVTF
jgi:hypothetical protein